MNSRTHHDGDLDPILRYAPTRGRPQSQPPPELAASSVDRLSPSPSTNSAKFPGDRAIVEMRQRLALEPEWIPEPPQHAAPRPDLWTPALRAGGIFGIAALLAWVFVFVPSLTENVRKAFSGISTSTDFRASISRSDMMAAPVDASLPPTVEAPPEPPDRTVAAERLDPRGQRGPATATGAASIQPPTAQQTDSDEQTRPAPPPEASTASRQTAPNSVTRHIDADELAAMEPSDRIVAAAEPAAPQAKEQPDPREQRGPATATGTPSIQPPTAQQTDSDEQTRPAPPPEASTAFRQTTPNSVTRHIDADELAAMLRRAEDFIKASDLSSARLLLQRAVDAGSMQAALTLAGTFDPNVLAGQGFQDGAADIAMARFWYERAEQLGSSEAPRRLRLLASNSL